MRMLKQALAQILNHEEIQYLSSSFDVIGDIAIIKIPDPLVSKEKIIAEQILANMKKVRTVLRQETPVQGEYGIRDLRFIAGEENFVTVHKESGCTFKLDVSKIYFSPRLSTERERIRGLVATGEKVLNMFAGVGTFSIIIAKEKECEIDSVDNNNAAFAYAVESLKLNRKLRGKVNPVLCDAREFALEHKDSYDRVLMPLPERASEFFLEAVNSCRANTRATIHYYVHMSEEEFYDENWIKRHLGAIEVPRRFFVSNWKKVREVGPRYIQAVADIVLP